MKLGGPGTEVEVDETFIGGKARNMHKSRRIRNKVREANWGKAIVMGMLERDGKVRARVVPDRKNGRMKHRLPRRCTEPDDPPFRDTKYPRGKSLRPARSMSPIA
jgi:hypothetical protein